MPRAGCWWPGISSTWTGLWRPGLARFGTDGDSGQYVCAFDAWPTNAYGGVTLQAVTALADGSIVCSATLPDANYDSYDVLLKLSATGVIDRPSRTGCHLKSWRFGSRQRRMGTSSCSALGLGSTLTRLHADGTLDLDFVPPADHQSTYYAGDLNLAAGWARDGGGAGERVLRFAERGAAVAA